MILRRVIEHFRRQEWTAIIIDFVIVVVGVFIGIQVANWNAGRAERQAYLNALDRLRGEIAASLEMLDLADADVQAELPVVREAYDALETCSDDPETRRTINAGLKLITGSNSIRVRTSELFELTSAPQLLSQQPPAMRRRLSDLRFYVELVLNTASGLEDHALQSRPERVLALRPGPRERQETTYLGIAISESRRPLQLGGPVSEACRNAGLVAALWAWDRYQGDLFHLTRKLRQEYLLTLDLLGEEAAL